MTQAEKDKDKYSKKKLKVSSQKDQKAPGEEVRCRIQMK